MEFKGKKIVSIIGVVAILVAIVAPIVMIQNAKASGLTQAYVRLDRLKTATATTGLVCARPTTATTTNIDVAVTFPTVAVTNYIVSSTASKWAATGSNIPTGTTAWPGIASATVTVSGQKVTWTYAAQTLNTGTTYCFTWADSTALTTSAAGVDQLGLIELHNTGPTLTDSSQYALSIIANDQVLITGTVNPTFTFSLSQTSTSFSSIGTSVVNASPTPVVSVTTNARNGYTAWVQDANNGTLNSAGASTNIPAPGAVGSNYDLATLTANGAFGLGVTVSGGSTTAATEYNGATAGHAGALSTSFRPMASSTTVSAGDTITMIPRAIAKSTQAPANDYTDTLTVVAAGQF
ncbi:MAG: hypothetical protein HGA16_00905 [Candidatus Moranbacteria bacterium]|jgi:hypothetical protein|nr:hypothetical protein [Candidatus Moranbacteria bacterium]